MRPAASLALVAVCVAASPAAADGPPSTVAPDTAPPPATRIERYGTHVALADAAWVASSMILNAAESSSNDADDILVALPIFGYALGGPIVHAVHGNSTGAVKSLTARVLLPIAGGFIGYHVMESPDDDDALIPERAIGAMLGASAGMLGAMILDWAVFAKHEVPAEPGFALRNGLRPDVRLSRDGIALSLGGTF